MRWVRPVILFSVSLAFIGLPVPVARADDELDRLVTRFFQTPDAKARVALVDEITRLPQVDVPRVAEAVGRVQLWEPRPDGVDTLDIEYRNDLHTVVHVRVPNAYDPTRRYPLILALHGQGQSALSFLQYIEKVLGDDLEEFLVAAPQGYRGMWFSVSQAEAGEPMAVLSAMRRRYPIDTDRVYVCGYSMGGHAAFLTAVLYRDWFAAAVPLAGTFTTPETPETKPILLPNLADFPMLVVWGERDTHDRDGHETGSGGIAGLNRTLRTELPQLGVKRIEFIELPGKEHAEVIPPRDRFLYYLQLRRDNDRKSVVHWFRFPAQGRMGWLRQVEFSGESWEGQMVVRVRPGEDVHAYARQAVQSKLGLLEGTIEGQTVRLHFQRTKLAEVLLHDGLIDFALPITVYRGNKIVFEGEVKPKVSTLLELAYADWEFQRLPCVRLLVPARGKAWQE